MYYYFTCEDCAHVATIQGTQEYSRCENCGSEDCVEFRSLDEAEEYSQEILDARN